MITLGACGVLCVLGWHLMGSAGCKVAWLKPQWVERSPHATQSAPSPAPSSGIVPRSGNSVRVPVSLDAECQVGWNLVRPEHRMHDDRGADVRCDAALRMVSAGDGERRVLQLCGSPL